LVEQVPDKRSCATPSSSTTKGLILVVIFSATLLTMIGRLKNKGDSCICYERPHPQRHARTHQLEENENKSKLRHHIPQLPSYSGEFDPKIYVNWEMEVDKEFRKSELSEAQKVTIAYMVLTNSPLNLWTHLARNDKVPKIWKDMKIIFRKECVHEYYADYLLAKLNNLKQGDNSTETYYHNLKFHIIHCGLEECEEATENRFLRGLHIEIQDMLLHETYNSLTCLVKLASKIEIQLALSEETIAEPSPTCENKNCIDEMPFVVCSAMSNLGQNKKDLAAYPIVEESEKGKSICAELNNVNDETHTLAMAPGEPITLVLNLSTTPASLEQSLVEPITEFPLLQDDYKIVPCDTEKLCDHASLISTTQLVNGHDTYILDIDALCAQSQHSNAEQVLVETCDDAIGQENDHLKREVKNLELEVNKLKKQTKVQPPQDNHRNVVKKLEKGRTAP
jgi:hypothetical protein